MSDYFIVARANNDNYPLLEWGQSAMMFRKWQPVSINTPVNLRLGRPQPVNPVMADYHSLPKPVISGKIKNVLAPLNIHGIQLLPAVVRINQQQLDYWLMHVYNKISCMDAEKSAYDIDSDDGRILDIGHLVLDDSKLDSIPLENRLVFALAEYTSIYLFHKSVKDVIMSLDPEGIRFFSVEDWHSNVDFI